MHSVAAVLYVLSSIVEIFVSTGDDRSWRQYGIYEWLEWNLTLLPLIKSRLV